MTFGGKRDLELLADPDASQFATGFTVLFPFLTFFGNDSLCLLSLFDVLQPTRRADKQCQLRRNKIALQKNHTPHPQIYFSIVKLLVSPATLPSSTDISCSFCFSNFQRSAMLYKTSSGSISGLVFVIGIFRSLLRTL